MIINNNSLNFTSPVISHYQSTLNSEKNSGFMRSPSSVLKEIRQMKDFKPFGKVDLPAFFKINISQSFFTGMNSHKANTSAFSDFFTIDRRLKPLHNVKEFVLEDLAGAIVCAAAENPELTIPGIKTAAQVGMRIFTLPLQTALVQHLYKGLTPSQAWKHTLKAPYEGWKAVIASGGSEAFMFYSSKHLISDLLQKNITISKKSSDLTAGFIAPIISTLAATPIDTLIMEKQLGRTREGGVSTLYNGIQPKVLRSMTSWGVGLTVGSCLNNRIKPITGDNLAGELVSMSIGWTIGSFLGTPFHNIYVSMVDNQHKTMGEALKGMNISLKDPKSILKNGGQLMKGFSKASPLILLTGITVASVGHFAKENLEQA